MAAGGNHTYAAHLIQRQERKKVPKPLLGERTNTGPTALIDGTSPPHLGTVPWFALSDEKLFWCRSVVFTVLVASAMAGVFCRLTTRTARAERTIAGPRPLDAPPFANQPASAKKTTVRELATTALQQAIGSMDIESIKKAINKHATAMEGTDVLKEARARRDRLVDRKRKADKQARRGPPPPPDSAASDDAVADDPVAGPLDQASIQASSSDADAAAPSAAATPAVPVDEPPPLPVVALAAASAAQFDTGRPPESSIGGQTTCIICMVNPKSHAAVPCGHQTTCAVCSAQCAECPICRAPITLWLQVLVV